MRCVAYAVHAGTQYNSKWRTILSSLVQWWLEIADWTGPWGRYSELWQRRSTWKTSASKDITRNPPLRGGESSTRTRWDCTIPRWRPRLTFSWRSRGERHHGPDLQERSHYPWHLAMLQGLNSNDKGVFSIRTLVEDSRIEVRVFGSGYISIRRRNSLHLLSAKSSAGIKTDMKVWINKENWL